MVDTFLPESTPWARREAGEDVAVASRQMVNDKAKDGDEKIFKTIAASNFYDVLEMAFNPDLALGTVGMWIERKRPGKPIKCQPIPIRELEINVGPDGGIDDRFVSRWTRNSHIPALTKGIVLPKKLKDEIKKNPAGQTNVTWCFFRDWEEEDEVWKHGVLVKDELIHDAVCKGHGSCPLIVGRFSPAIEWPWGIGPLIKALPDLRIHDALTDTKMRNIELGLDGPIAWLDDSFTNIEEGLECRMAYAVRPGSHDAIKQIYTPNPPDAAVYEKTDLEQRLRRLFYLDWPHQRGDSAGNTKMDAGRHG
jgi:Bacteriophage head to tail connecting protein